HRVLYKQYRHETGAAKNAIYTQANAIKPTSHYCRRSTSPILPLLHFLNPLQFHRLSSKIPASSRTRPVACGTTRAKVGHVISPPQARTQWIDGHPKGRPHEESRNNQSYLVQVCVSSVSNRMPIS